MAGEFGFEILLDAMTSADSAYDRALSLSLIEAMTESEKHRLRKLQESVLPADRAQVLQRRIQEGFDAFGEADLLAGHDQAVGEAFKILAEAAKHFETMDT